MTIIAAADGSSLGNPGPAGWAWYIADNSWSAGGWPMGTNNVGELRAVLELLEQTAVTREEPLTILCDSQYVINSVTKWMPGWKRKGWRKADGKPVSNQELLRSIDTALHGRVVTFEWVKGHAGHPLNEAADQRARACAQAYLDGTPVPKGPGFFHDGLADSGSGSRIASASKTGSVSTTGPVSNKVSTSNTGSAPKAHASGSLGSDVSARRVSRFLLRGHDELSSEGLDFLDHDYREITPEGRVLSRADVLSSPSSTPRSEVGSTVCPSVLSEGAVDRFLLDDGQGRVHWVLLWNMAGKLLFSQGTRLDNQASDSQMLDTDESSVKNEGYLF